MLQLVSLFQRTVLSSSVKPTDIRFESGKMGYLMKNKYKEIDQMIRYFFEHVFVADRSGNDHEVKLIITHTSIKLLWFIL